MSWSCKKCTFLNPLSQKPTCQICLSPSSPLPSAPSSSAVQSLHLSPLLRERQLRNLRYELPCRRCRASRIRETRATATAVGTVFFPLQRCKRKRGDQVGGGGRYRVEVTKDRWS
ncbi:hypothetical protein BT93_D0789 [Corymbia citriodora subsp. variegata]|nr:hypothetical protein BT93_D0789 [Corymbia citriodora subsp. variegata]